MFSKVSKEYPVIAWFSGGITSAIACWVAINLFGIDNVRIVFIDTQNEDEDTYRFLADCEIWYSKKIERITAIDPSGEYTCIEDVWDKFLSLNVAHGAICSSELKRAVRLKFQKTEQYSFQTHGFDLLENKRSLGMTLNYSDSNPIYPLPLMGLRKVDCFKIAKDAGMIPPRAYGWGLHNNNCLRTGCVQGGIGYWQWMFKNRIDLFDKMAAKEHYLTDKKGSPVTMLKDQGKDGGLVFLKPHPNYPHIKDISMMKGREPKPLMECNGFCGIDDLGTPDKTALDELNFDQNEVIEPIIKSNQPTLFDSL